MPIEEVLKWLNTNILSDSSDTERCQIVGRRNRCDPRLTLPCRFHWLPQKMSAACGLASQPHFWPPKNLKDFCEIGPVFVLRFAS